MNLRTCIAPGGEFIYGIHKPRFTVVNLRQNDHILILGRSAEGRPVDNARNFPEGDVHVESAAWVFEIPNAFPFLGATYIIKSKADTTAGGCNPFVELLDRAPAGQEVDLERQPRPVLLALAATSDDPVLLANLARRSCRFAFDDKSGLPSGMIYPKTAAGKFHPAVLDQQLFELVANNPHLPDIYKQQMVLIPGVQGDSPIVGEWTAAETHIWEYLRENSYIPWGHYAANMAHDAVRYRIGSLSGRDMMGLRHLYYQRIYVRLAVELGLSLPAGRRPLTEDELEELRLAVIRKIGESSKEGEGLPYNATLWGQNFGSDASPSGYRLNASHQQIHQQFALVPPFVPAYTEGENHRSTSSLGTYTQGDLVAQFSKDYREKTGRHFFDAYLEAISNNKRLDGRRDKDSALTVYQDEKVVAFVPKAQRSPGEVQVMTREQCGNIVEADPATRNSLDRALLLVMRALENLGAEMVTALEISKRLDNTDRDQRLLYCFLPRHPQAPGGFSEWQQRWISNHYPEDFAATLRSEAEKKSE